ncbi:TPA: hypothetical protein ACHB23_005112, partial [Escherichia coli]
MNKQLIDEMGIFTVSMAVRGVRLENGNFPTLRELSSSRQPGGCGLSWPEITVIKTDNIIVFQLVIWP